MITIEELTKLKRIWDDWKWREPTDEELKYSKNFPDIFAQAIQLNFDPEFQSRIALNLYNDLNNNYYMVANEDGDETKYLTFYAEPTNDICEAAVCVNQTTAFFLIDDYKETKYCNHEIGQEELYDHDCDFGFKIVPVRRVISYERL